MDHYAHIRNDGYIVERNEAQTRLGPFCHEMLVLETVWEL